VSATVVSAPGKLFLIGEYAVLDGGTAVVAAVNRRAIGRFVPGAVPSSALVEEAVRLARAHLAANGGATLAPGAADIDTSALAGTGGKLGLGSSAAAAAVAVGAALQAGGHDPESELAVSFALAERAHRNAQDGRGSGADVAAAVYGGIIAYRRDIEVGPWEGPTAPATSSGGQSPRPLTRLHAPAGIRELSPLLGLEIVVFHAGVPHATVDAIRAVEALAARDRPRYERHIGAISGAADAFLTAWQAGDVTGVIEAADAAGTALAALGPDADLPIVTPPFARAAALARELGGAAKPSGAGGGDVGVAFLTGQDAAATFRARAPHIGVEILSIRTAARGLGRGTQ
jgi:phosphomevalonate kinase